MNESEMVNVNTPLDDGQSKPAEAQQEQENLETKREEETPEARVARLERELDRARRKAGIAKEDVEKSKTKPKGKPFELGYDHKAFLNANGVRGLDEYNLVQDYIVNTGKDLEEVIDSRFFQAELKELRAYKDSKAASDALSGNKRGQQSARDTVDYWLNKGDDELPPPYMKELRRQVVASRMKKYDNSVSPFGKR